MSHDHDPDDRPPDIEALIAELHAKARAAGEGARDGEGIWPPPPPPAGNAWKMVRRVLAVVVAAGLAAFGAREWRSDPGMPQPLVGNRNDARDTTRRLIALCNDGTLWYGRGHPGSCSHRGGVRKWLDTDSSTAPGSRR